MRRASGVVLAVLAAGCGGGSAEVATTGPAAGTTAAVTVTTQEDTANPTPQPTGRPKFRVRLTAESPQARAGRPWRYTVRATAPDGSPADGTAKMRVFVDGELVDTLGFFVLQNGVLNRTYRWQPILRGESDVVLQAEVEGAGGTQRVNYRVTVT